MLKREVCGVHTGDLTWSWGSSAHPGPSSCSLKGKEKLAANAKQGRNWEGPQTNGLDSCKEDPSKPLSGPVAISSGVIVASPALSGRWLYLRKTWGARSRESAAPHRRQKKKKKSTERRLRCSEAQKTIEVRLVERKVCFISEAGN